MDMDNYLGRVVCSKAGRDMGKRFLIVGVLNDEYVYISDGRLRNIEKPKKKKLRHLTVTDIVADEIKEMILSDQKISNPKIKKYLQSQDSDKEV